MYFKKQQKSFTFTDSGRIALAQAHAKLSLRTEVLEEDAVIAVLLCESSVTLKHGLFPFYLSKVLNTKKQNHKHSETCKTTFSQEFLYSHFSAICIYS